MSKVIILLSGGLDSATCLFLAKESGHDLYALSCYYGQRHRRELRAANELAQIAGVMEHTIVDISSFPFDGSALTRDIPIPVDGVDVSIIPTTYVPARNTIFLSLALSRAEQVGAKYVYIGVNSVDYSGYPDCRPDYIAAMQVIYWLGTKAGREGKQIEIVAPLLSMNKVEIIRTALRLEPRILSISWSCYSGGDTPCGMCDSCRLRNAAIAEVLGE